MQTLRKKSSPLKYKNDPSRFLGDGMTFKAKLIGILEVNEARGDKMCQDALNDLKTAVRAAGEHKQRITISIAIDGLRLRDEKTGDSMYHHPVHKISFIAQDMSDSRAFGYIFGSPDTGHRFFGIKTDKTASQVVIAMRDLFQVVFELKKKEIEMAKHHIEQHQIKYTGSNSYPEHPVKDEEIDRTKPKTNLQNRNQSTSHSIHTSSPTPIEGATVQRNSEAIADLLDLEDELNNIQQGISQMDKITPSDPFGPLNGKGESFMESFKDKTPETPALPKPGTCRRSVSQGSADGDKTGSMFSATSTSSRAHFFPQFSPNVRKSKEESYWFDQETDSLFTDAVTNNPPEPPTSPITFHTPTGDEPVLEETRSPVKTDVFTDLDPLGTGRVRPYLDKKDFFQELKNPPKKVLKELMPEPPKTESTHYFPVDFESRKVSQSNKTEISGAETTVIKNNVLSTSKSNIKSYPADESKLVKADPFEDTDPFEKTDPFLEESFPKSIGFPPILHGKISLDYKYDKVPRKSDDFCPTSPSKSRFFSSSIHGPLRVSLPPEKADTNTTISLSSIASRFRSSPSPTEEPRSHRRKHYQTLKHSIDDRSDDQSQSPILEEVYMRGSPKSFGTNSSEKKYFIGSPPASRSEKMKSKPSSSLELLDSTPDLPLRSRTALYAIKPPPLPPKKQNQPTFRPPARPPSLEDTSQYDYLRHKVEEKSASQKDSESSPKKRNSLTYSENCARKNSATSNTGIPLLPPPPQRKTPTESGSKSNAGTPTSAKPPSPENKSVMNITLNQLDQSGFETLASTLGISTENVCNMTLQQLTKMLAKKYLGPSEDIEQKSDLGGIESHTSVGFTADFESNFGESKEMKPTSPTFDKYAPFKELMGAKDNKEKSHDETITSGQLGDGESDIKQEPTTADAIKNAEEEDKYAALRQLSLCAQKSENLSEELENSNEEDSSARADNMSDSVKHHTDDSFTPLNVLEITNESPIAKSVTVEETDEIAAEISKTPERTAEEERGSEWSEIVEPSPDKFGEENSFFGSKGEDDLFDTSKEDWATFEKETTSVQIPQSNANNNVGQNDNENSPLSSDGKDEIKGKITWSKNVTDDGRHSTLWNDEDESWDDYSPKESYWSDESSHDGHSPIKEALPTYLRRPLNKHSRLMKGPPVWSENIPHRHRRWEDDTEDEYDDLWRKRRMRPSSYDRERKREKSYDIYEKQFNWGRESWDGDRLPRGYEDWRKSGLTVGDYRRRCDSDASDKEYTNKENRYTDLRGGKAKQYYMQQKAVDVHWSEQRESRCKFKKPTNHKRPSSASEAKRYEKMYSPIDHSPRSLEKTGMRESEDEDFPSQFQPNRKDLRYQSNIEYYGSYDRRVQTMYHKRMHRGKRSGYPGSKEVEMTESQSATRSGGLDKINFLPPDTPQSVHSNKSEDTPEPTKELHFQFEDDFIPSPVDKIASPRLSSNELQNKTRFNDDDWKISTEESVPRQDNNNSRYASFVGDFEASSKGPLSDRIKNDGGITKKPSLKGKNHFAKLGRQDSSTSLRKSESINIFSRDSDPFEDDDFFSASSATNNAKLQKFSEKSKSNSNVSDPFAWKEMFTDNKLED